MAALSRNRNSIDLFGSSRDGAVDSEGIVKHRISGLFTCSRPHLRLQSASPRISPLRVFDAFPSRQIAQGAMWPDLIVALPSCSDQHPLAKRQPLS